MKNAFIIAVALLFTTGCASNRVYSRYVDRNFKAGDTVLPGTAIVSVTNDSLSQVNGFVAVKKESTAFIPAIVYVQIKQTKICELNPQIATKIFDSVCSNSAANWILCIG